MDLTGNKCTTFLAYPTPFFHKSCFHDAPLSWRVSQNFPSEKTSDGATSPQPIVQFLFLYSFLLLIFPFLHRHKSFLDRPVRLPDAENMSSHYQRVTIALLELCLHRAASILPLWWLYISTTLEPYLHRASSIAVGQEVSIRCFLYP